MRITLSDPPVKTEVHWAVTAAPAPDCAQLKGATDADVLVVGGG